MRRASMVADVDVVVDDALDVGLQWTRLFRSILLGKYGSIVCLVVLCFFLDGNMRGRCWRGASIIWNLGDD